MQTTKFYDSARELENTLILAGMQMFQVSLYTMKLEKFDLRYEIHLRVKK